MTKTEKIDFALSEHISLLHNNQNYLKNKIDEVSLILIDALLNKKKIIWCGNGGSAAQASHLSAELVGGMFKKKKSPLKSICLNTDTAFITACLMMILMITFFLDKLKPLVLVVMYW